MQNEDVILYNSCVRYGFYSLSYYNYLKILMYETPHQTYIPKQGLSLFIE
jgi:hypothetical protein